MKLKTKEVTLIALLSVIIVITGSFKMPGIFPGTEFQLSAPIAVAIAGCFGFKRYISAGIVASAISLMLGTHTILNVITAMTFRIFAGGTVVLIGNGILGLTIAGPIGSLFGRVVLSMITKVNLIPLIVAAIPGMIYTSLASYIICCGLRKLTMKTSYKEYLII